MGWHGCPLNGWYGSFPRARLASKSAPGFRGAFAEKTSAAAHWAIDPGQSATAGGKSEVAVSARRFRPAAAERELADGPSTWNSIPVIFANRIDVAGSDGTSAEAHVGRCQYSV